MRLYIGLLLLLLPIGLLSIVREVALDGSQPYSSIRTAVSDAVAGDIILVHPGRYLENLNLSNKSDLTLCSLEYTTGDSSYIRTTIIDGSRANISTIVCYENVLNCTIQGLSITGGNKTITYKRQGNVFQGYPRFLSERKPQLILLIIHTIVFIF